MPDLTLYRDIDVLLDAISVVRNSLRLHDDGSNWAAEIEMLDAISDELSARRATLATAGPT